MSSSKDKLREKAKALRDAIPIGERAESDALITAGVLSMREYASAKLILTYLDFSGEVRTRDIIIQAWAQEKVVALPACVPSSREMRWYEVESFDELVKSKMGMSEPDPAMSRELAREEIDRLGTSALCIVPGLVFDESGNRLGYGGGFYDEFLSGFSGISAGLSRESQMVESLEELVCIDAHDRSVDIVVTDERIVRCS